MTVNPRACRGSTCAYGAANQMQFGSQADTANSAVTPIITGFIFAFAIGPHHLIDVEGRSTPDLLGCDVGAISAEPFVVSELLPGDGVVMFPWGSRSKTQLDGRHQRRRLPPCSVTGFSSPAEAVMAGLSVGRLPAGSLQRRRPLLEQCYSSSGPFSRPGARPCLGGRGVLCHLPLFAPEFTRCVQDKSSALGEVLEAPVRGAPYQFAEHREHMVALVFRHRDECRMHILPLDGRLQRERLQPIEKKPSCLDCGLGSEL